MVFMSIELQAKWVALVLSDKITLPPEEDMVASIDEYYRQMEEIGKPKRYTHALYPTEVSEITICCIFLKWTMCWPIFITLLISM